MRYLHCSAYTHNGKARESNEDNFSVCGICKVDERTKICEYEHSCTDRRAFFAVCDGIGGEKHGERAARIAVAAIRPSKKKRFVAAAANDIARANTLICRETRKCGGARMGTTVAALYIDSGSAAVSNLGDSRIYLLRDGFLVKLTQDHTYVQSLLGCGAITEQQASTHADRHILTQHLGIFPKEFAIEPMLTEPFELREKDRFLLCSDGLYDMIDEYEMRLMLSESSSPRQAARRLVNSALDAGGRDNITVLIVDVR